MVETLAARSRSLANRALAPKTKMRMLHSFHATALRVKHTARFLVLIFVGVSSSAHLPTRLPHAATQRYAGQKM
jgi:hypothetical protein